MNTVISKSVCKEMYNFIMFYCFIFMAVYLFILFYFQSGFSAIVSLGEKAERKKLWEKKYDGTEVREG